MVKSEALRRLQKEKLEIAENLLTKLEVLKKVTKDVSCARLLPRRLQKSTRSSINWIKCARRSSSSMVEFGSWR